MAVRVKTDSTKETVSVDELRTWLRIDTHDEDAYLLALTKAARMYAEDFTARAFIAKTFQLTMDRLPTEIRLQFPPTISITSITYYDADNVQQTLDSSLYFLDNESEPARVVPAYDKDYPDVLYRANSVAVTYVAGYGTDVEDVPEGLKTAIKFLAAHWYENREPVAFISAVTEIPLAVKSLLWQFRIVEVS